MDKYKPDFKKAYCMANEILIQSYVIEKIPFDVKKHLREETDIALKAYQKANNLEVDGKCGANTWGALIMK
jgi:hypothetical protein